MIQLPRFSKGLHNMRAFAFYMRQTLNDSNERPNQITTCRLYFPLLSHIVLESCVNTIPLTKNSQLRPRNYYNCTWKKRFKNLKYSTGWKYDKLSVHQRHNLAKYTFKYISINAWIPRDWSILSLTAILFAYPDYLLTERNIQPTIVMQFEWYCVLPFSIHRFISKWQFISFQIQEMLFWEIDVFSLITETAPTRIIALSLPHGYSYHIYMKLR